MADEEENPLFAMDFSEDESCAAESTTQPKVPRDFQSEADFQHVKRDYRAKAENGDLYTHLPPLPVSQPSKQVSQAILHAIEELYFFRRYREALDLTEGALNGELDAEFKKVVEGYNGRCLAKLGA